MHGVYIRVSEYHINRIISRILSHALLSPFLSCQFSLHPSCQFSLLFVPVSVHQPSLFPTPACSPPSPLQSEARSSCLRLFPPESFALGRDTLGDTAVKELSEMVLNDQPGVDPRWGEGRGEEGEGRGRGREREGGLWGGAEWKRK